MNLFCFSFALNQKYRAANFFTPRSSKIRPKISPLKKRFKITIATQTNKRNYRSVEEKGLVMQSHSINIEKLPKQMKNNVSNIAY